MKKLISGLLAVMMLCTAASAFAASATPVEKSNALTKFLDETDLNTKDLAFQVQSGDEIGDLVLRLEGDNLHLVAREGDKVDAHVQFNSTGIYVKGEDSVTLLRYATVITILQDIIKEVNSLLDEASVLSALGVKEYELPDTVEPKTPIGVKLVFEIWSSNDGVSYAKTRLVYQSTEQLRGIIPLSLDNPPVSFDIDLPGLTRNADGYYRLDDLLECFQNAIDAYDALIETYISEDSEIADAA